ncbi:Alpha-(1,3)-fucosyltransferase 4 [Holothuria leucospilota]|uniref:Fucosyltransferase n=1 Tax=Holothuria leucospilota TaxID=206669 RepID=A0A9Q1BH87_HOLLE|nr:Alpha-(1,3)-fucosyltransferase 4 [Holothuria leucospilota]
MFSNITVAFFEGFRRSWPYGTIFQAPEKIRYCNCSALNITVARERLVQYLGRYDIIFVPQDVGCYKIPNLTWNKLVQQKRNKSTQRWIYASFEGVYKIMPQFPNKPYNKDAYDWSFTYHSKSDFPMPYGYYKQIEKGLFVGGGLDSILKRKTKLISWMSTWNDCEWPRKRFVDELGRYLPIHRYGGRTGMRCPRSGTVCEMKMKKYKFYLALENSCCSEYITEKFWRTLTWDIVPVVVGAPKSDYLRFAPPGSFIYANDFSSVKGLAEYLLELDSNDELYVRYLQWKVAGKAVLNYPDLNDKPAKTRVPPDTFFYSCSSVCRVGTTYQENSQYKRKYEHNMTENFDPYVSWWGGSCRKCTHLISWENTSKCDH